MAVVEEVDRARRTRDQFFSKDDPYNITPGCCCVRHLGSE